MKQNLPRSSFTTWDAGDWGGVMPSAEWGWDAVAIGLETRPTLLGVSSLHCSSCAPDTRGGPLAAPLGNELFAPHPHRLDRDGPPIEVPLPGVHRPTARPRAGLKHGTREAQEGDFLMS